MTKLIYTHPSLLGLWVGDAFGGNFEFESVDWYRPKRAFESRELPHGKWRYTDDTQMTLSIYELLKNDEQIDPNKLADSFVKHFDISRGYGIGTEELLLQLKDGGDWSKLSYARYGGNGSQGNGSAMRVAPVGTYFYTNLQQVIYNAKQSSIVTHTHPDAVAGAIAVALASAQTTRFAFDDITPSVQTYWETILEHTPSGELHNKLEAISKLPENVSHFDVAKQFGCGWDVTALDTVPFALWCAIHFIDDFEEALWHTISVGGDADTTGAIVGGIIAPYVGKNKINQNWIERCDPLPTWVSDS